MKKKSKLQKAKDECVAIATAQKLEENPRCVFCPNPADTCHHFVHQSRSNYLRDKKRNLIPICEKCHCRLHNGYEQIMALQLRKIYGGKWADRLTKDARITIKDNLGYWKDRKVKLQSLDKF